jgi:hypothetical protein
MSECSRCDVLIDMDMETCQAVNVWTQQYCMKFTHEIHTQDLSTPCNPGAASSLQCARVPGVPDAATFLIL